MESQKWVRCIGNFLIFYPGRLLKMIFNPNGIIKYVKRKLAREAAKGSSKTDQDNLYGSPNTKAGEGNGRRTVNKLRLVKSTTAISVGFAILFASYNPVQDLQSSLNKQRGITSLWVVYAFLLLSALGLPKLMIGRLGAKWTMVISGLCYAPYIAAQYYPSYYTLIPGAILVGLGAAPLWTAERFYMAKAGEAYAPTASIDAGSGIARCNALFVISFKIIRILGNVISSEVLSSGNYTERSEEFNQICGANYCPWFAANLTASGNSSDNREEELRTGLATLTTIYLAFALVAALVIAVLVDPLSRFGIDNTIDKPAMRQILATIAHLKKPNQMLIVPLSLYGGIKFGFVISDFTAGYISCAMGPHMIGYVMMCNSICSMVVAYIAAHAQQKVGRLPIITLAALMNVATFLVMLYWTPSRHQPEVFFILAGLWGGADAIWNVQMNAFYAVIFKDQESAYSNVTFWGSTGVVIGLATSSIMCVAPKLYSLLGLLAVGMLGYYIVEVRERRKKVYVR